MTSNAVKLIVFIIFTLGSRSIYKVIGKNIREIYLGKRFKNVKNLTENFVA